jgi:hypothetical protein
MHFDPSASHLGCTVDFAIIFVPNRLRHCLISERHFHMAQRAIRFSATTDKEIQAATRKRGFSKLTAFIRHLVEQELSGRQRGTRRRRRTARGQHRAGQAEVSRLGRTQQALFAFLDTPVRPHSAGFKGANRHAERRQFLSERFREASTGPFRSMVGRAARSGQAAANR